MAAAFLLALGVASVTGYFFFGPMIRERWAKKTPPASGKELQVHILDVGLGDSILIIAPSGKTALIDAGVPGSGKKILDAFKRYGVDHLDLVVATHEHADHIGGMDEILKATNVGALLYNGADAYPTKEFQGFRQALKDKQITPVKPAPGQTYDLGDGVIITALAPIDPPFTEGDMRGGGNETNANSVVLRLDYGAFSMLLAGDAEAQTEQRLASKSARLSAEVLKVAHHGSKYATSDDFIKRGQFKAAIISTSADNRYGLPAQDTLNRLKAANVKVYRTDMQGEISIATHGKEGDIKITAAREPKPNEDLWTGRAPLRDDSARRGFLDFGDLPPAPKPTPEKVKTKSTNGR